jgi:hypothetical protein
MANPKGSENVSSTVKGELAREIEALAGESGLSRSSYVRALLEDAVAKRRVFRLRHAEFVEETPVHYRPNEKPNAPPVRAVRAVRPS